MRKAPRLTETLKNQIVQTIRAKSDFDGLAELGVSIELLERWIGRARLEKSGLYRELRDELRPLLGEAYRRDTWNIIIRFFGRLSDIAKRDARFRPILTIWLHTIGLNDAKIPDELRLEAAKRIMEALDRPIHHTRWQIVEKDIVHLARLHRRTPQAELTEQTLQAIFLSADDLKRLWSDRNLPDALTRIVEEFRELRRRVNEELTTSYAGPGWRQKPREKEWEGEAPGTATSIDEHLTKTRALAERQRRQDFFFDRAAMASRKTLDRIKKLIEKYAISDIKTFAEKLGVERAKLYRDVIEPTRKK